ncbi:hypothetical protein E1281_38710 [Actinomadura sp. KC345]|uniref:hypothetical protein n=1 Tax=Actinomadura sp. KC345 TaxID=2530371 RepID=UPI001049C0A8|nr:hypothetical protein [Actinomadura sp. KC345]TDC39462.1 hypothetical protein E1281_38710 [Actinomadura sp. KC345]
MTDTPGSNPVGGWYRTGKVVTIDALADTSKAFDHIDDVSEETLQTCWKVANLLVDQAREERAHSAGDGGDITLTVSIVRKGDARAVNIEVTTPRKDGSASLGSGQLSERDLGWWGTPEEGTLLWLQTVTKEEYARRTDTGKLIGVILPIS